MDGSRLRPRKTDARHREQPFGHISGALAVAIGNTAGLFINVVRLLRLARTLLKIFVGSHSRRRQYGGQDNGSTFAVETVSRAGTDRTPMGFAVPSVRGV